MNKHMINKTAVLACLLLASRAGWAQEAGVEMTGGLQGLQYDLPSGNAKLQAGASLGATYTFPLSQRFGIVTGISAGYYKTKATLKDDVIFVSYAVDDNNSAFHYQARTRGFEETQRFFSAGIPVLLQYHTLGNTQWYVQGGGKLLLPFNGKISSSASSLALAGYYPDQHLTIDELPQHGFGTIQNWKDDKGLELKPAVALSLATGFSFRLSEKLRLYTGVYADYGLNNMKKSGSEDLFVTYAPTGIDNAKTNGVLTMTGKARAMSFGIQVKLGIDTRKRRYEREPEDLPTLVAPLEEPKPEPKPTPPPAEKANTPAPPPPPVAAPSAEERTLIEKSVGFTTVGSTDVPENLKPHLDSVAQTLTDYDNLRVLIIGHTCDIGNDEQNARIGEARAKAVAGYLVAKGVAPDCIDIESAGKTQPLVPNTSEQNRRQNRRVTIRILQ
ncbi:OmpA family protein [Chitinophaga lutea]